MVEKLPVHRKCCLVGSCRQNIRRKLRYITATPPTGHRTKLDSARTIACQLNKCRLQETRPHHVGTKENCETHYPMIERLARCKRNGRHSQLLPGPAFLFDLFSCTLLSSSLNGSFLRFRTNLARVGGIAFCVAAMCRDGFASIRTGRAAPGAVIKMTVSTLSMLPPCLPDRRLFATPAISHIVSCLVSCTAFTR